MALFRKLFNKKPPDGLLEISERVYAFDCCFSTEIWEEKEYKFYIEGIVHKLRDHFPDASFMAFNFQQGEHQSQIASTLSEYDMTVMDYPRQYEGCPLLTTEMIHHFLKICENWLSLGQQNMILIHSERGGLPVLAFMLAALLLYQKQLCGEKKTLEMIYKLAPRELLHLTSPLNPLPSQLRYLQYVSGRNMGSEWPPSDKALTLDCIILRFIPNMDGEGGCRPIFRVYGRDPIMGADKAPKVLFSTPKNSKLIRYYKQVDSEVVKINTYCHVVGDVVLECISLDGVQERELMMFRIMFNTAYIRSNILMLNREEIDTLWNGKDQFSKDFRAEVIFSDVDVATSAVSIDLPGLEDKGDLPIDDFAKGQDVFSKADYTNAANILQENLETGCPQGVERAGVLQDDKVKEKSNLPTSEHIITSPTSNALEKQSNFSCQPSDDPSIKKFEPQEIQAAPQKAAQHTPSAGSPSDSSSIKGKTESQELHVAPHEAEHSKKYIKSSPEANSKTRNVEIQKHEVLEQLGQSTSSLSPVVDQFLARFTCTNIRVVDVNSIRKKTEPQELQAALQRPAQPKIISQRSPQSSISSPVSCSNSLQGSPAPISRYCSAASALGITALLHDHDASESEDRSHAVEDSDTITSSAYQPPFMEASPPAVKSTFKSPPHPHPPPPLHSFSRASPSPLVKNSLQSLPASSRASLAPKGNNLSQSPPPPPQHPSFSVITPSSTVKNSFSAPLLPPPLPTKSSVPQPPPPPPPTVAVKGLSSNCSAHAPSVPPPPAPCAKGLSKASGSIPSIPGPPAAPLNFKGFSISRIGTKKLAQEKKSNLKPYHWLKLTRAVQGSLWAEAQKPEEASKAPEIDMSELESLFSTVAANSNDSIKSRRAYNCEIMLTKVKIPLPELTSSILTLDDTALDCDQLENLIKFCPTKEEEELLKGYNRDKDKLGKCEQFFLELIKVPRVESKLRVFLFKIQFFSQIYDLRNCLNIVNSAAEEVRNSVKLKRIMQTILCLGNALNRGTARGSAVGFRLDSLLKLSETRSRDNKMTLMHYLCKGNASLFVFKTAAHLVLEDKLPELLEFPKDLVSLEASTKIQLKYLAEEMQAISKGLEKVVQELAASENDGPVSETFCLSLKEFFGFAESEVKSLALLYSTVGRNADALSLYFGEDPARCTFEQVVSILLNFVRMFVRAHVENHKQLELEKKKAEEAENEKMKVSTPEMQPEQPITAVYHCYHVVEESIVYN
ncbi:Formin-like protein 6 [Hibiscus syriacus]|uniref:Formin-like protein n=1 Tax=Hibiscus syriacus TaxID=106335 RepID=A0A6A3CT00_HIBSY|nr:Formin-like protein 6 [Hibiscus syriacus]